MYSTKVYVVIFLATVFLLPVGGAEIMACRTLPESWTEPGDFAASKVQEQRIKALEDKVLQLQKLVLEADRPALHTTIKGIPKDCGEIYRSGVQRDGEYTISPDGRCPFLVYCDMTNGGWTLIQKRESGSVNFYRPWDEYVAGFGDISGGHWLGLDKIHRLIQSGYQIYFDLENYDGSKEFAHYKTFTVHGPSTKYRMNVDAFGYNGSLNELLSNHDNMAFSTFDRDNDNRDSSNCCTSHGDGGGWWYKDCYKLGNLNGVYGKQKLGGIGYWDGKLIYIKNVQIKVKTRFELC